MIRERNGRKPENGKAGKPGNGETGKREYRKTGIPETGKSETGKRNGEVVGWTRVGERASLRDGRSSFEAGAGMIERGRPADGITTGRTTGGIGRGASRRG